MDQFGNGRHQDILGGDSARYSRDIWRQKQGRPIRTAKSWEEHELKLRPGLWRLHVQPQYSSQEIYDSPTRSCLTCKWSETYVGLDGVTRRRCRFNAPECPCVVKNLLPDGNMEAVGTEAWSSGGTTPVLSKQAMLPDPGQCLRILQSAAGPAQVYSNQTVFGATPLKRWLRVRGEARTNGTATARAYVSSNTVPVLNWFGTASSIVWESFDLWTCVVGGATTGYFRFGTTNGAVLNDYVEFRNIRIEEPDLSYGRWNNVLDEDWCSHFLSAVTQSSLIAWFRANDSVTWVSPSDGLTYPGPVPAIGGGYTEPIPPQDGYRDLWLDGDAILYILLPPHSDFVAVLLSEADDIARR